MRWNYTAAWDQEGDATYLTDGRRNWRLEGRSAPILRAIEGLCRTQTAWNRDRLVAELARQFPEATQQATTLVEQLAAARVLVDDDAPDPVTARLADFCALVSWDAAALAQAVRGRRVRWLSLTPPPPGLVARLDAMGVTLVPEDPRQPTTRSYDGSVLVQNGLPAVALVDVATRLKGTGPHLPVLFNGWTVTLGPTVIGEEACLACAMARRLSHYEYPQSSRVLETLKPSAPAEEPWGSLLTTPLVPEILRLVKPPDMLVPLESVGTVVTVDVWTLEVSRARVFRVPECPVCGLTAGTGVAAWV